MKEQAARALANTALLKLGLVLDEDAWNTLADSILSLPPTEAMVEAGAQEVAEILRTYTVSGRSDGMWQLYGPDDAAGKPTFSSISEEDCALFIAIKCARTCLTEAARVAKEGL